MYLAVIWKKIARPLRYLLVLLLIYYLVARGDLDLRPMARFFRLENLPCLGLLFLILAGSMLCLARRQQLILAACGTAISFGVSFKVVMVGMFYNNFLPGGFGGDLIRLNYLRQGTRRSYSSLAGILLLDRFLGVVGLSACALGGRGSPGISPGDSPGSLACPTRCGPLSADPGSGGRRLFALSLAGSAP